MFVFRSEAWELCTSNNDAGYTFSRLEERKTAIFDSPGDAWKAFGAWLSVFGHAATAADYAHNAEVIALVPETLDITVRVTLKDGEVADVEVVE